MGIMMLLVITILCVPLLFTFQLEYVFDETNAQVANENEAIRKLNERKEERREEQESMKEKAEEKARAEKEKDQ